MAAITENNDLSACNPLFHCKAEEKTRGEKKKGEISKWKRRETTSSTRSLGDEEEGEGKEVRRSREDGQRLVMRRERKGWRRRRREEGACADDEGERKRVEEDEERVEQRWVVKRHCSRRSISSVFD